MTELLEHGRECSCWHEIVATDRLLLNVGTSELEAINIITQR